MKRLFLYLFLILFTLPTPSQADDIRDFQIEGMSLGDSALDYFSKGKIIKGKQNYYKNKKASVSWIITNSEKFTGTQLHWWTNDKRFKIIAVSGIKKFINNMKGCYELQNIIDKELSGTFIDARRKAYKKKHIADPTGKSTDKSITYTLKDGNKAVVSCYDWSKKMEDKYFDHLHLSLITKKFNDWLHYEAYK